MEIGKKTWAIAEGYIPPASQGPLPEMESHETVCILNVTNQTAHINIMIYFSDRDPLGPYIEEVSPQRTKHLRFNNLNLPAPIPLGVDFSSVITSDCPIVVQHTRLDSRQEANALLSTIAYSQ